jgi:phosphoribosylglycinamide formyltransferase-1
MRLAFYVSGKATCLRNILRRKSASIISDTRLVVTDSTEVIDLEQVLGKHKIKLELIDYQFPGISLLRKRKRFSNLMLNLFRRHKIDYCFCFGSKILHGDILKRYRNRIVNFHPSVLPMYPGLNAIDRARQAGAFLQGNTAHFVDEGVDTGPIILQSILRRSAVKKRDYGEVLQLQIPMALQIHSWLKDGALAVRKGRVRVAVPYQNKAQFFPSINEKFLAL